MFYNRDEVVVGGDHEIVNREGENIYGKRKKASEQIGKDGKKIIGVFETARQKRRA